MSKEKEQWEGRGRGAGENARKLAHGVSKPEGCIAEVVTMPEGTEGGD